MCPEDLGCREVTTDCNVPARRFPVSTGTGGKLDGCYGSIRSLRGGEGDPEGTCRCPGRFLI